MRTVCCNEKTRLVRWAVLRHTELMALVTESAADTYRAGHRLDGCRRCVDVLGVHQTSQAADDKESFRVCNK